MTLPTPKYLSIIAELKGVTLERAAEIHQEMVLESRIIPQQQCDALMAAGWSWMIPSCECCTEPWQLQWRRPPRKKGSKGLLCLSTNQAYQRLRRERPELKLPELYG